MAKRTERSRTPRQRRRYRARSTTRWLARNANTPAFGSEEKFDGSYRCHYCRRYFKKKHITRDHIIPRSIWREAVEANQDLNITHACRSCNKEKADSFPTCACQQCAAAIRTYRAWAEYKLGIDFEDQY